MYARVRDVARRLNLKLEAGAHVNAPYSFVMEGTLIPAKQWPESPLNRLVGDERRVPPQALGAHYVERRTPFTSLEDWMKPEAARYDISLAQWLVEQKASPEATRLIHLSQGSTPLEQMALLRMMQEAARSKVDVQSVSAMPGMEGKDVFERFALASSHVVGGTSRLVEAIGASLGDSLRLGARVRSIRMDGAGAELRCANGLRVRAKYVVVAVPFSVLREIDDLAGAAGRARRCGEAHAVPQPEPGLAAGQEALLGRGRRRGLDVDRRPGDAGAPADRARRHARADQRAGLRAQVTHPRCDAGRRSRPPRARLPAPDPAAWIDAALASARPQAVAALLRYFRDLDTAEEAFQEACLRALKNWPQNGPPRDPAAWLIFVGATRRSTRCASAAQNRAALTRTALSDLDDAEAAMAERLDGATIATTCCGCCSSAAIRTCRRRSRSRWRCASSPG
jgi:hypothetical protein